MLKNSVGTEVENINVLFFHYFSLFVTSLYSCSASSARAVKSTSSFNHMNAGSAQNRTVKVQFFPHISEMFEVSQKETWTESMSRTL